MSTSLNLSGKLPSNQEAAIIEIAKIAKQQDVPFFIIGALARDLILECAYDIPTHRATNDIDFGIRVENWQQFKTLKRALIETGGFREDNHQKQRLFFGEDVRVDIVPFGQIEDSNGSIAWPPQYEVEMSTLGFSEAYDNSIKILLTNDVEIAVSSPAGLALMKLIAWNDRRANRDALDLALLMKNYIRIGNENKIFGETAQNMDLLEVENFDYEFACARLLGRDVGSLLTDKTISLITEIVDRETALDGNYSLAIAIASNRRNFDGDINKALEMLKNLKQGIFDVLR